MSDWYEFNVGNQRLVAGGTAIYNYEDCYGDYQIIEPPPKKTDRVRCSYCGVVNKTEREDCRSCGAPIDPEVS